MGGGTMSATLDRVLDCFPDARRNGVGFKCRCPSHDDKTPSLSVSEGDDGRVLIHCFGGCTFDELVAAIGLEPKDLFDQEGGRGFNPPRNGATVQHPPKAATLTCGLWVAARRRTARWGRTPST